MTEIEALAGVGWVVVWKGICIRLGNTITGEEASIEKRGDNGTVQIKRRLIII